MPCKFPGKQMLKESVDYITLPLIKLTSNQYQSSRLDTRNDVPFYIMEHNSFFIMAFSPQANKTNPQTKTWHHNRLTQWFPYYPHVSIYTSSSWFWWRQALCIIHLPTEQTRLKYQHYYVNRVPLLKLPDYEIVLFLMYYWEWTEYCFFKKKQKKQQKTLHINALQFGRVISYD